MIYGSFEHNLDEKNRLVIPSKLRECLSKVLFIIKGFEGCISIYPEDEFNVYLANLSKLDDNIKISRDFKRVALSSVCRLEIDSKNRIQIPTAIVNKYSLDNDVIIVGMINHIEIWNLSLWKKYFQENETPFEKNAEKLLVKNDE